MLEEIRDLLILQNRDQRLLKLAKDLAKLPQDEAKARARLKGDTEALEKARDNLNAAELKVKKISMDTETRKNTVARLKTQQFETKKNDEYTALGNEVIRYEKQIDEFETLQLEAMVEVDGFRELEQQAKARLEQTEKIVNEDLAAIRERHGRMEAEQKEVQAERDVLVQKIPEDLLPLYERLLKSKDGQAMATLKNGMCTGCHMKVIASTVVAVHAEKEVAQCENCGRILSMDE